MSVCMVKNPGALHEKEPIEVSYSEGESSAGCMNGEHSSADVPVVLEIVHQVLPRVCLHAAVDADVPLLCPAQGHIDSQYERTEETKLCER